MTLTIQVYSPPAGLNTAFSYGLLGLTLPVRGYLLVRTFEPHHPDEREVYLVHNDDIFAAIIRRDGPLEANRFKEDLPVGQVTAIPINCCKGVWTSRIEVTRPLPSLGHDPNHCDDFIGLTLEADGHQVAMLRLAHPEIPPVPHNVYQVSLEDAVEALRQAHKEQDVIYWGSVARPYLIEIPRNCAKVDEVEHKE